MIALSFFAMLGAAALPAYNLPPARHAKPAKCTGDCSARYRLPASSDDGPSLKARALAVDGSKCNVIGAKRCTTKGRMIWHSDY